MSSHTRNTDHPSLEHSDSDHVFDIGENDIVLVQERTDVAGYMRYVVRFKDAEPTGVAVEEAIELMRVFADITWDFEVFVRYAFYQARVPDRPRTCIHAPGQFTSKPALQALLYLSVVTPSHATIHYENKDV